MTDFLLKDTNRGKEKTFNSKAEAKEKRQDMIALGATPEDLEIRATTGNPPDAEADGGQTVDTSEPVPVESNTPETVPEGKPAIDENPTDWLPSHFIDEIQGVPTLNRKGYAVMCERFGVSVKAEPVTLASETDNEYAEFRATAETEDGTVYSGFGSAHVDRGDGDDTYLLNELAETRAMKRAASWATGLGMTAAEEMQNDL